jgi:hypothetical protein
VIEPLLSRQWFCKMAGTPMIDKAIRAVATDEVRFVPPRYKDLFFALDGKHPRLAYFASVVVGASLTVWLKEGSDPDDQASYVVARSRKRRA